MELFTQNESNSVYTVSEINFEIKDLLEGEFARVSIQGEISNFRPAASGHIYFSLKDSECSISAALFRGSAAKIRNIQLRDGKEVICHGRISAYPPRGSYQLIVNAIDPVGEGSLQAKFEALKKKLQSEGLFEASKKRELPKIPRKIALITSPSGAAVRDVLSVLKRRSAAFDVVVVPTLVQGEGADREIIKALKRANDKRLGAEVVLLTRGGGSIEDLWCFNSEALARAIASSRLPVVSAVGHEIDFTIADFVADYRAPTPSAAAEILTQESEVLMEMVDDLWDRLLAGMEQRLRMFKLELRTLMSSMKNPADRIRELRKQFSDWNERLLGTIRRNIEDRSVDPILNKLYLSYRNHLRDKLSSISRLEATLHALSPVSILERGYSIVMNPQGQYLRNAKEASIGEDLRIRLGKGSLLTEVKEIGESG